MIEMVRGKCCLWWWTGEFGICTFNFNFTLFIRFEGKLGVEI